MILPLDASPKDSVSFKVSGLRVCRGCGKSMARTEHKGMLTFCNECWKREAPPWLRPELLKQEPVTSNSTFREDFPELVRFWWDKLNSRI